MTELERKQDRAPVPAGWDYAPAPEARDLVQLRERYGHFVGGEWLEPRETYTTIDPSSEEALAEVGQASSEEVDLAVTAARPRGLASSPTLKGWGVGGGTRATSAGAYPRGNA